MNRARRPAIRSRCAGGAARGHAAEAEILFWIGQGKTNEEIGIILSISRRTVHKHVEHLLAKLEVENRTAAARLALAK